MAIVPELQFKQGSVCVGGGGGIVNLEKSILPNFAGMGGVADDRPPVPTAVYVLHRRCADSPERDPFLPRVTGHFLCHNNTSFRHTDRRSLFLYWEGTHEFELTGEGLHCSLNLRVQAGSSASAAMAFQS